MAAPIRRTLQPLITSPESFAQTISDAIQSNPEDFVNSHTDSYSHADERHVNTPDSQLIDNMLTVREWQGHSKQSDTTFNSKDEYIESIALAMSTPKHVATLYSFLKESRIGDELSIEAQMPDIIGHGFMMDKTRNKDRINSDVHTIKSIDCSGLLLRVRNQGNFNWSIKTACPLSRPKAYDMHEVMSPGNADVLEAIRQSQYYQNASLTEKAALELMAENRDSRDYQAVYNKYDNGNENLAVWLKDDPDTKIRLKSVKGESNKLAITCEHYDDYISPQRLKNLNPWLHSVVMPKIKNFEAAQPSVKIEEMIPKHKTDRSGRDIRTPNTSYQHQNHNDYDY